MDRMTKRAGPAVTYTGQHAQYPDTGDVTAEMSYAAIRDVMLRLAKYEDTGLTPEQIDEMKSWVDKIVAARDAGGLLVLPCAIGTPVYTHDTVCSGRKSLSINCKYGQDCRRNPHIKCPIRVVKRPFTLPMYKNLGKTFWLTEEEAEAAIPASRRQP